ncbi:MAG: ATP synthase F0 subunit C [candidate division Zixibacteria bacterium]|nr:ATP synthase F0 subunit C [candidate division Zixibacteria bacterium]
MRITNGNYFTFENTQETIILTDFMEEMMDFQSMLSLSLPIGVGIAAIGSGVGLGRAVGSAMEAIGRQPEASGKIQTAMIIGAALIEALTIYALVVFFILQGKIG